MDKTSSVVFQIGHAHLVLESSDASLTDRFRGLYGDCEVAVQAAHGSRVDCHVRPYVRPPHGVSSGAFAQAAEIAVDVFDHEPVNVGEFMEAAFGDRGCRRVSAASDGQPADGQLTDGQLADGSGGEWQAMASDTPRLTFRLQDRRVVFPAESDWRALAANLAIAMVLRLQRDTIFLHASGIAFGSARRGVLFVGPKGAGKTTTALGLASRGHVFFGDEIVGVRQSTGELVPVLRTIAKRDGPCARAVDAALTMLPSERRQYAGGESRTIVAASRLFATPTESAALSAIVFLDGFDHVPALTALPASLDTAARLTPVTSTLWGRSHPARAFALARLLGSVSTYALRLGPPDATAPLLEQTFTR